MLDKLRDHGQSQVLKFFIYLMLGAIIVVFAISFGPGSWGQGASAGVDRAALVNGTAISAAELDRAYGDYLDRYRQATGQPLTEDTAKQMGIRVSVMESLIKRELLAESAQHNGIRVSDSELRKYLLDVEGFKTDDVFDPELYRRYVTNVYNMSPSQFEARLRKELLQQKLLLALKQSVKLSDGAVERVYIEQNDKIDLEYVRLSPYRFKAGVKASDEDIDDAIATRQEEIARFYEAKKFKYDKPKRVRARHILFKIDSDASDEDQSALREKAEKVLAELEDGGDFEVLVSLHSEDEKSREQGGDLGWFGPGSMLPPFEKAAFALEPGEVSPEVVETRHGYHLIKVEEVKAARTDPLSEVEREIAELILQDDLADEVARAKAEEILDQARAGRTLAEIAPPPEAPDKTAIPSLDRPDFFSSSTGLQSLVGGRIPGIGRDDALATKLLAMDTDAPLLAQVAVVASSYYVIRVLAREKPDMDRFEDEKEALRTKLLQTRQRDVEKAWVDHLRSTADVIINQAVVSS